MDDMNVSESCSPFADSNSEFASEYEFSDFDYLHSQRSSDEVLNHKPYYNKHLDNIEIATHKLESPSPAADVLETIQESSDEESVTSQLSSSTDSLFH